MIDRIPAFLHHRHSIKFGSVLLAYSLWFCIAQYQTVIHTVQASIYVYDTNAPVQTVDHVTMTVQGPRNDMYRFSQQQAVINIDGSRFKEGSQEIIVDQENLFLPDSIKLVNLVPSHITIQVT